MIPISNSRKREIPGQAACSHLFPINVIGWSGIDCPLHSLPQLAHLLKCSLQINLPLTGFVPGKGNHIVEQRLVQNLGVADAIRQHVSIADSQGNKLIIQSLHIIFLQLFDEAVAFINFE